MAGCSCGSGSKTLKGRYNKIQNLQKPIDYYVDRKGNVKPVYTKN